MLSGHDEPARRRASRRRRARARHARRARRWRRSRRGGGSSPRCRRRGSTRPAADAALGADRAEEVGPVVAGVARRARARAALRPDPGERALLADAGLVLEPDLERLAPRGLGQRRRYRLGEVFLNASCAAGSALGMLRAHRQAAVAAPAQILATVRSCSSTAKRSAIRSLQVAAAASAPPRPAPDRARPRPSRKLGHLRRRQPRGRAGPRRFASPASPSAL